MKKSTKILATASSVVSGLFLASATYAGDADTYLANLVGKGNGTTNTDLMAMIYSIINWAVGIAALICVVILIVSGYKYITAAGDENKVESATKTLTFAIIGLVVCFIAVILVQFVIKNIINIK
jgi:formate-dependent nitrite reductase membrane component NrfD